MITMRKSVHGLPFLTYMVYGAPLGGSSGRRSSAATATSINYRRTQTKHRKAKNGHEWTKLERIKMDRIWVNWKNVGPPFFSRFISVCIKMAFTKLENHSQLLCGRDFANERLFLCQFDVIINKLSKIA